MRHVLKNLPFLTAIKDLCQPIPAPKHGDVKCSRSRHRTQLFYKTKCSFACHAGYKIIGPAIMQCNGSGQWDEDRPMCIRKEISRLYTIFPFRLKLFWFCAIAQTCSGFAKPKHGQITPAQCLTGDIFAGERCILHCDPGYKPANRRAAICDPQQNWLPSANLTCAPSAQIAKPHLYKLQQQPQYIIKPYIKCPPDATKLLGVAQKTILIKMEQPKTNVDWWK